MDYRDYVERLRRWESRATIGQYGEVTEHGRPFPLLCVTTPGARELVVTAGFHGEEPAGPLTLLEHLGEVIDEARAHDVALRVFPCVNPSGFEGGHRYNASGEQPNNDFLRYELTPGTVVDEVGEGQPFHAWQPFYGSPKETLALHRELERHAPPRGALDLHQDAWVKAKCFYAYHFGAAEPYRALVKQSLAHAKVAVHLAVHNLLRTDRWGLIVHHDGSNSDWFHRRGVPHVAVLETTTRTDLVACHAINLVWIRGMIRLVAEP
ncbi:MAG: succinylglutamate desuccinylase/aspartoacylase family protein [Archangium sp.]|nr:succinylglutamate desuccinylase/aspartoacylase family protein [Archangium sp.]